MMESQQNGNSINDEYDFSNVKPMQNHNPHRSKSMTNRKTEYDENDLLSTPLGGLSPVNDHSPEGSPVRKTTNEQIQSSIASSLLQAPNLMDSKSKDNINIPNHSPHNRSPSLKIRRYSFLAGSRRGRGFSEIFNSTILNDHFDQYSAQRDDSGLGRELISGEEMYRVNHITEPSPDSGVSESLDEDKNRSLCRRQTMPCIVKEEQVTAKQTFIENETAHSSENIAGKNPETYIIENGIRKRIKGVERQGKPRISRGDLPNEYHIESQNVLSRLGKHGSLPDIHAIKQGDKIKPMSRDEVYRLGSARREELRHLQDLAERRRQGDVTVILGDLKVNCLLKENISYKMFLLG